MRTRCHWRLFQIQNALKNIWHTRHYPVVIYMFKVNNRNTRTRCEICSELTIKTPELRQWRHPGFLIVNIEHISHLIVVFLLLTGKCRLGRAKFSKNPPEHFFGVNTNTELVKDVHSTVPKVGERLGGYFK